VEVYTESPSLYTASDPLFSLENLSGTHLSMVLHKTEVKVAIISATKSCLAALILPLNAESSYETGLIHLFQQYPFLIQTHWASVQVAFTGISHTLIPLEILHEADLNELSKTLFQTAENEQVQVYVHKNLHASLFVVEITAVQFLQECFSENLTICHQTSGLIAGFLSNFHLVNSSKDMLVLVAQDYVTILIKEQSRLLFCNSYPCATALDAAYYVILVMKELGLNPDTEVVSIFGQITLETETYAVFYNYIRYVYFGDKPAFLSFSSAFDNFNGHRHFDVFGLHLCQ